MTDQKILEASEKVLKQHVRLREDCKHGDELIIDGTITGEISQEILSAIKPLLPPTDLVKVCDLKSFIFNDIEYQNLEVYRREVK